MQIESKLNIMETHAKNHAAHETPVSGKYDHNLSSPEKDAPRKDPQPDADEDWDGNSRNIEEPPTQQDEIEEQDFPPGTDTFRRIKEIRRS